MMSNASKFLNNDCGKIYGFAYMGGVGVIVCRLELNTTLDMTGSI